MLDRSTLLPHHCQRRASKLLTFAMNLWCAHFLGVSLCLLSFLWQRFMFPNVRATFLAILKLHPHSECAPYTSFFIVGCYNTTSTPFNWNDLDFRLCFLAMGYQYGSCLYDHPWIARFIYLQWVVARGRPCHVPNALDKLMACQISQSRCSAKLIVSGWFQGFTFLSSTWHIGGLAVTLQ